VAAPAEEEAVRADRRLEEEFDEVGERAIFDALAPAKQETLLELLGRIQRPLLDRRYRA
jgi:hypothetical protein